MAPVRGYISKVSDAICLILQAKGAVTPYFPCIDLLEIQSTERNSTVERNRTPLILDEVGESHTGYGAKKDTSPFCSYYQLHG